MDIGTQSSMRARLSASFPLECVVSDIQRSVKSMWRVNTQDDAIDVGCVGIATALCSAVQCSVVVQ